MPRPGEFTVADAQSVLASQPFSVLLSARLTSFGDGAATLEIDIRDDLRQQHGYVHGGVLAYAADNALTFAGGSALGPAVLTAGFTIAYLRPVQHGTVRATAHVVQATRGRAVCHCEIIAIRGGDAALACAVAQGTIAAVRE